MMEDDGTGATQAQSNVAKANNMIVVNLRSMVVALDFVVRMAPKAQVDQALAIRSIQRKSHPEGWLPYCVFNALSVQDRKEIRTSAKYQRL
jgi:hypothetical protein